MIDDKYLNFKSERAKIYLDQIDKALSKLDIPIKNPDGTFRNYIDVLQDLQNAWERMSKHEKSKKN